MMVATRSRMFGIVRVAMIPGIAQANDDSSGMKAPERPAAHHAIQQVGRARQVATVLEREDEE